MKKITLIALAAILPILSTTAQNVGIGTASPNASAKLDIVDANRGILLPRVALTATNVQAPVTSPANWLIVFNTNVSAPGPFAVTEGLYYWDGTLLRWVRIGNIATPNNNWTITGNAGTAAATNFIGTLDAVDFVTRTNNTERMRVTSAGLLGVGTSTPLHQLDINPTTSPIWTSNSWRGLIGLNDAGAIGWRNSMAGGQTAGIGHTSNGTAALNDDAFCFFSSAAALGTNGSAANYSMRIFDQNNQVAINNGSAGTPDPSAQLEVTANARGLLIPRVSLTQTTNIAPVATTPTTSLLVYNTATINDVTPGYYYWGGTRWERLMNGTDNPWTILGNTGTNAATNFIGTTDAVDFVTRTNNTERMRVTSAGNVGVGTNAPVSRLSISGNTTIGANYAGVNAAPANGLRVEGRSVINKASGEDSRDIFSSHTSAAAFSSVIGYPSVTASRAVAGYADGGGMGIFGFSNRTGYGVVGLTQTGNISGFVQRGEGVLGQADGATGILNIPIGVHGIIDETVVGLPTATPVLGENNNITRGNGFTGGAYATPTAQSISGVYGNIGSRGAAAGDNGYMFGVIGDILVVSGTIPDGSGGVLGSSGSGSFGMLGYKGLTSTIYSVYGGGFAGSTAAGNTGNFTGGSSSNNQNNAPQPNNHIGLGINGGFMGGYVKGSQYGMVSSGQEFGMYVQGKTIVNQPIVQLTTSPQGTDRIVSYAPTSTQVDVMTKGTSALVNGEIFVPFDDNFRKLINHNEPVIINITPRAETRGVYVSQVTAQGFYVRENMQGTSNAAFYWSATGTKSGFESGVAVSNTILNNNFDSNLGGVMMGEGEASARGTEPTPIYFDGQNVLFQRMPERFFINANKNNPANPAPNGNSGNNNTH